MKGYLKDAAVILAVIAVVKLAKTSLPIPAGIANLLP